MVNCGSMAQVCHCFAACNRPMFTLPSGNAPAFSARWPSMCNARPTSSEGGFSGMRTPTVPSPTHSPLFAAAAAACQPLGSPPAQYMRPSPVKTATRMSGRSWSAKSASLMPAPRVSCMELFSLGRLKIT